MQGGCTAVCLVLAIDVHGLGNLGTISPHLNLMLVQTSHCKLAVG